MVFLLTHRAVLVAGLVWCTLPDDMSDICGMLVWQVAKASGACRASTARALLKRGDLAALRRASCTLCAHMWHAASLPSTGASDTTPAQR